jgi:prepilin-type N-terminal cleavage/methylation domain-containing protein
MYMSYLRDREGFTLVELMISLAIIGILIATTVPLANMYRIKAEYLDLRTTSRYLMDGMETYYLETNQLYPPYPGSMTSILFWDSPSITVSKGEEKYIPELKYTFSKGHKHSYTFDRTVIKIPFFNWDYDMATLTVEADFDYDRDGKTDKYTIYMWLDHGKPNNRFQIAPGIYKDRYRAFEQTP